MEALKKRNDLFQITALANTGVLTASLRIFRLWLSCSAQVLTQNSFPRPVAQGVWADYISHSAFGLASPSTPSWVQHSPIRKQSFQGPFSVANECGGGRAHPVHCSRCPSGRTVVNREGPCSARGASHAEPPPEQDLVSGEVSPERQAWRRAAQGSSPRQRITGLEPVLAACWGRGAGGAVRGPRPGEGILVNARVRSANSLGLFSQRRAPCTFSRGRRVWTGSTLDDILRSSFYRWGN